MPKVFYLALIPIVVGLGVAGGALYIAAHFILKFW